MDNEFEKIKEAIVALRLDEKDSCYEVKLADKLIEVRINEQLYFSFEVGFSIHAVNEIENQPLFSGRVQNLTSVSFFRDGEGLILEYNSLKDKSQVDKIISIAFGRLCSAGVLNDKEKIAKAINNKFKINLSANDIGLDLCDNFYYLKSWNDANGFESFIVKTGFDKLKEQTFNNECKFAYGDKYIFAKYTSLDTLLKILKTENLMMFSLAGMNDRKEIGFYTSNENNENTKRYYDLELMSVLRESNKRFITSLTSLLDNLDMWRFYGDNGQGVSIEFAISKNYPFLYPISYYGKENNFLSEIKEFVDSQSELKFKSLSLRRWQYYIKPDCFKEEKEFRILIEKNKPDDWCLTSTGVITPCINYNLDLRSSQINEPPVTINSIILGPNMKEKDRNMMQLEFLMKSKGFRPIRIDKSKIDCYIV